MQKKIVFNQEIRYSHVRFLTLPLISPLTNNLMRKGALIDDRCILCGWRNHISYSVSDARFSTQWQWVMSDARVSTQWHQISYARHSGKREISFMVPLARERSKIKTECLLLSWGDTPASEWHNDGRFPNEGSTALRCMRCWHGMHVWSYTTIVRRKGVLTQVNANVPCLNHFLSTIFWV